MKEIKIDKLDFTKIQTFFSVKDTIRRMKREATGRKYLQNIYLKRTSIQNTQITLKTQLTTKKALNFLNAQNLNKHFTKEDIKIENKNINYQNIFIKIFRLKEQ